MSASLSAQIACFISLVYTYIPANLAVCLFLFLIFIIRNLLPMFHPIHPNSDPHQLSHKHIRPLTRVTCAWRMVCIDFKLIEYYLLGFYSSKTAIFGRLTHLVVFGPSYKTNILECIVACLVNIAAHSEGGNMSSTSIRRTISASHSVGYPSFAISSVCFLALFL